MYRIMCSVLFCSFFITSAWSNEPIEKVGVTYDKKPSGRVYGSDGTVYDKLPTGHVYDEHGKVYNSSRSVEAGNATNIAKPLPRATVRDGVINSSRTSPTR